jgi:hypothetical protein
MKLTKIAVACAAVASALLLSGNLALAKTVRHEMSARTYQLHRGIRATRSPILRPNYGNPNGDPNGPTTLSGTGSSEFGGSVPGSSGYN